MLADRSDRIAELVKQVDALLSVIERDQKFWDEDKARLAAAEAVCEAAEVFDSFLQKGRGADVVTYRSPAHAGIHIALEAWRKLREGT